MATLTFTLKAIAKLPHSARWNAKIVNVPESGTRVPKVALSQQTEPNNPSPKEVFKTDILLVWAEGFSDKADNASNSPVHERIKDPKLTKKFPEV